MRLREAGEHDLPALLALIGAYAERDLLLPRTEASLRARLADFAVVEEEGRVIGCGALTELGPGLGEVRSLAVAEAETGRGVGSLLVRGLLATARIRGFPMVLALTRRRAFFEALGFRETRREQYLDKLAADCSACPKSLCCDEVAMVREPPEETVEIDPPSGGLERSVRA